GETLWSHSFDAGLDEPGYRDENGLRHWAIGDIDGDQVPEVLFVYNPRNVVSVGGTVFCFSSDGKLRWQFRPDRIVETAARKFSPPYFISNVQVLPATSGSSARVL